MSDEKKAPQPVCPECHGEGGQRWYEADGSERAGAERMTLPYDYARCFGVGSPQCYDCLRRTEPGNPDGRQSWILPNIAPSEPCALRIVPEEGEALET